MLLSSHQEITRVLGTVQVIGMKTKHTFLTILQNHNTLTLYWASISVIINTLGFGENINVDI